MNPVERAFEAYKLGGAAGAASLYAKLAPVERRQFFIKVKELKRERANVDA